MRQKCCWSSRISFRTETNRSLEKNSKTAMLSFAWLWNWFMREDFATLCMVLRPSDMHSWVMAWWVRPISWPKFKHSSRCALEILTELCSPYPRQQLALVHVRIQSSYTKDAASQRIPRERGKEEAHLASQVHLISSGVNAFTKSKNHVLHCFGWH